MKLVNPRICSAGGNFRSRGFWELVVPDRSAKLQGYQGLVVLPPIFLLPLWNLPQAMSELMSETAPHSNINTDV